MVHIKKVVLLIYFIYTKRCFNNFSFSGMFSDRLVLIHGLLRFITPFVIQMNTNGAIPYLF